MMYYHWGFGPFLGGAGLLLVLIWWFIIISLVISLFRWIFGGHRHHRDEDYFQESDSALNILRERYAKGDITKKEFDAMKKDLSP